MYNKDNRPIDKVYRTNFRCNNIHKVILEDAMEEYDLGKSEMLRHIIVEWNMLRYND